MVFWLIPVIISAVSAVLVGEVVRRPLGELFEGQILTEEAPVRTAMTMYVSGAASRQYFIDTMVKHNIQKTDQDAYLAYADKRIQEKQEGEINQYVKTVNSHLEKINTAFDKIDTDTDDIEFDAFVQDVKNQIVDLDLERDVLRQLLTAAVKKGTEAQILPAVLAVNAEINKLNMSIFDKRKELMARRATRLTNEYNTIKAITPVIPEAPIVTPVLIWPPSGVRSKEVVTAMMTVNTRALSIYGINNAECITIAAKFGGRVVYTFMGEPSISYSAATDMPTKDAIISYLYGPSPTPAPTPAPTPTPTTTSTPTPTPATGKITLNFTDSNTGAALAGVSVNVATFGVFTTDASGNVLISGITLGQRYDWTATKSGYNSYSNYTVIYVADAGSLSYQLVPIPVVTPTTWWDDKSYNSAVTQYGIYLDDQTANPVNKVRTASDPKGLYYAFIKANINVTPGQIVRFDWCQSPTDVERFGSIALSGQWVVDGNYTNFWSASGIYPNGYGVWRCSIYLQNVLLCNVYIKIA